MQCGSAGHSVNTERGRQGILSLPLASGQEAGVAHDARPSPYQTNMWFQCESEIVEPLNYADKLALVLKFHTSLGEPIRVPRLAQPRTCWFTLSKTCSHETLSIVREGDPLRLSDQRDVGVKRLYPDRCILIVGNQMIDAESWSTLKSPPSSKCR